MINNSHQSPEHNEQLAVDSSLKKAGNVMAELMFEPEFQQYLADQNISTDDEDTAPYWRAVAEFTESNLLQGGLSDLDKDCLKLASILPLDLTEAYYLSAYGQDMDYSQRKALKTDVVAGNVLLKEFVTKYPQKSDQLQHSLMDLTLQIMGDNSTEFTNFTTRSITERLKGVRHEIGFKQILDNLGVDSREATIDEDLKGRDLIILFNGREIGVDVKASLSEVEAKNKGVTGSPIARKPNGDLVMFSMLLEKDFKGAFEPNKQRVDEIAPVFGALLQKALVESMAVAK